MASDTRMNIRAMCTDIDGTLLDSNRQLSAKTIDTIKRLNKRIPVILASSRMPSAMTHLQDELGITGLPLICYNGGFVIQYRDGQKSPYIFDSVTIPLEICRSILSVAEGTEVHVSLYFEDNWYAPKMDYWTEREERITKVKSTIADPDSVIASWAKNNNGAHKVMCMGPEDQISTMAKKLHEKHGQDIHIYFSRSTYLELAPRKISKASALELILKRVYNLTLSEAIAFGDNYNDIDMLNAVGLGIAVENAREEAKAVAKAITLKSVDDGVAVALEKYSV